MFAVFQGGLGELEVGPHGSDYRDRVDVGRADHVEGVGGDLDGRIGLLGALQHGGVLVAYGGQLTTSGALKIARHHWAPVAITDYADFDHFWEPLGWSALRAT